MKGLVSVDPRRFDAHRVLLQMWGGWRRQWDDAIQLCASVVSEGSRGGLECEGHRGHGSSTIIWGAPGARISVKTLVRVPCVVRERTHSTCAFAHTTQSEPKAASKEAAARTCAFAHTTQSANSYSPKPTLDLPDLACMFLPPFLRRYERPRPRVLRLASRSLSHGSPAQASLWPSRPETPKSCASAHEPGVSAAPRRL